MFPASFTKHLTRIYNLRISYPSDEILLLDNDVSSELRWIKRHPDIASVFAFAVDKLMFIPTGQTFSSNTSPSNWEVLAQARTLIGEHHLIDKGNKLETLLHKHKQYFDKIKTESTRSDVPIIRAIADAINR